MTVGEKLLNEIERVSALRQQYKELQQMPGVNVGPVILLMSMAIDAGKVQLQSDDPAAAIRALRDLEEFTE